jgi:release factor glutamine methyltransferase
MFLEIGPGSGVLSAYLVKAVNRVAFLLVVDVNPEALHASTETNQRLNQANKVDKILADGTSNIFRSNETFDVVLCNPPYVPADRNESNHSLTAAWAGGLPDGREVTDGIIRETSKILKGKFYLLLDKRNGVDSVIEYSKQFSLVGSVIRKKKIPGEVLYILEFAISSHVSK